MRQVLQADPAPSAGQRNRCSLAETQLRVGDAMYLELPRMIEKRRATITLVGWLEGRCLIVTAPQDELIRQALQHSEDVVLRGFSGRTAYALRTAVMKPVHAPIQHLYLEYPAGVDCVTVRNSIRCRVALSAQMSIGDTEHRCTIRNLSAHGALLETATPLQSGDVIDRISWSFELHGLPVEMALSGEIRRARPDAGGSPGHYGLQFRDLLPPEKLALVGFVTHQVLENPASAA